MAKTQRTNSQQRIDALQDTGRLAPAEAARLREAFDSPTAPADANAAGSSPAPQPVPDYARAFLSGAMDEATLGRSMRQRAAWAGGMFGAMFVLAPLVIPGWRMDLGKTLAIWLPLCMGAGWLFGYGLHRIVFRPMRERLVKLRREAGPLQPLGLVDAGQCPACRAEDFDVWTWRHPAMLHWIANPGLAFNELVFGQLVPATTNLCRQCHTSFVDCPHCHLAIDSMQWGGRRNFGHWRGLPCPHCGGAIPVLANALAYLVKLPFRGIARLLRGKEGQ